MAPAPGGPLAGTRVLDMTSVLMGPYATQLLGQFGAEVIKLEPPEGDVMRYAGAARHRGMGHVYMHANRGKRSVVLDLKQPAAKPVMDKLVASCDVLVYNQRPRAMARLGLAYEDVKALNPRIIYAGGLGFSTRGRRAERPAYDDMIQTMAGIPWLSQEAGSAEPRYMPGAFADRFVGLHLALGITAAIAHRERTGEGQRVDVPMYESLLSLVLGEHLGGLSFVPQQGPVGYRRTLSRDRRPYRTADGYIGVIIYTDRQWRAFFDAIGQSAMCAEDTPFHSAESRSQHVDAIYGYLQQVLQERSTQAWLDLFDKADIPAAPVGSIEDILLDEHLLDIAFVQTEQHPSEGTVRTVASPFEFSASPAPAHGMAPRLGEHTLEVLKQLGVTEHELLTLATKGVIATQP